MKENTQSSERIPNILIVDDLPANLKVLGDILFSEGYTVRQVSNGVEALNAAQNKKPDLILLDILMPDMGGFEVCQRLKQNIELKEIPVIFISALNDTENIVQAFTVGGVDYINKPFQAEEVKARVKTHLKIHHQNIELRELNATKDKFFSIIAHDLRGPMASLMQFTELMAYQAFTTNELQEMTASLYKSSRNTFNLLENLLEWSRMERGFYDFKPESMCLQEVVSECLDIVAGQAQGKNIELVSEIIDDPNVIADKNMLQSVIRNLLSNAIKFTRLGGRVTISARKDENNQLLVSVKDNGIGMTEDLRKNLFRIDARTKRPGTQGEQSTGLGLLLCKEFVEKHGGKIAVESEMEIGSVFNFTVPFAGSSPNKNTIETVVPDDIQKGILKKLKILIAEDDEITSKLISYFVKSISYQVFMAKTGLEAVEICRNNPDLDLVIMDIKMPYMDGYEATRQIRRFNPKLVILAHTSFAIPAEREIAMEAGITDYVVKPFHGKVFVEMAQKYVGT